MSLRSWELRWDTSSMIEGQGMIRTSLIAIGIVVAALIGMFCSRDIGPTGDSNPRPPTPRECTTNPVGRLECPLQLGRS